MNDGSNEIHKPGEVGEVGEVDKVDKVDNIVEKVPASVRLIWIAGSGKFSCFMIRNLIKLTRAVLYNKPLNQSPISPARSHATALVRFYSLDCNPCST